MIVVQSRIVLLISLSCITLQRNYNSDWCDCQIKNAHKCPIAFEKWLWYYINNVTRHKNVAVLFYLVGYVGRDLPQQL